MVHFWYIVLLLPVVVVVGTVLTLRVNAKARYYFDYLKLRMPITGTILQKITTSRRPPSRAATAAIRPAAQSIWPVPPPPWWA